MKKILFIFLLTLSSCYWDEDLNIKNNITLQDEYYWYYDNSLFKNVDSCQVIGTLGNKFNNNLLQINRSCKVQNDTIYVIKRYLAEQNNIFNGVFHIKGKDPYRMIIELE